MSCIKKSNGLTMETYDGHPKSKNVHKIGFQPILMTSIFYMKIDLIVYEPYCARFSL